ncbi:uncharacterized protein DSM5745_09527 [Aspergillus mulundensis]|uniref:Uncharacterized protein n=1 Tax=Aspergillus mulundensis TaxID=1810919 RepID=A0A3D8QVQ7_9EURO|nr:hypothetical protein DSM5745_09527 [Aspergillus mulundensis]RDW65788.1 hypothetical protein DSM5745_09527 [Aspergillus mulundensis]
MDMTVQDFGNEPVNANPKFSADTVINDEVHPLQDFIAEIAEVLLTRHSLRRVETTSFTESTMQATQKGSGERKLGEWNRLGDKEEAVNKDKVPGTECFMEDVGKKWPR